MARVNDTEVKEIIDTQISTLPFIEVANLLVTEHLTGLHDDATLKQIEKWLAAHFVAIRDPQVVQAKVGEASETYFVGKRGEMGLNATQYGQQVLLLDSTGTLGTIGKKKVLFEALCDDIEEVT